jgi:hypothetical protein
VTRDGEASASPFYVWKPVRQISRAVSFIYRREVMEWIPNLINSVSVNQVLGSFMITMTLGLICLHLKSSKKRWTKILRVSLSLCNTALQHLKAANISLTEVKVTDLMGSALDGWRRAKKRGEIGNIALSRYFTGGASYLVDVESAYKVTARRTKESPTSRTFVMVASTLWRLSWITSRFWWIAVAYMGVAHLRSAITRDSKTNISLYRTINRILRRGGTNAAEEYSSREGIMYLLQGRGSSS